MCLRVSWGSSPPLAASIAASIAGSAPVRPNGPVGAEADGPHFFFGGFLAAASASAAFALASAALPASIAALR